MAVATLHPHRAGLIPARLIPALVLAVWMPGASARAQAPSGAAELPKVGPVEELYNKRQYEAALLKADELVAQKKADGTSEYWAARALRVLKRFDEAADRFRALSRNFPDSEHAPNADIDAEISVLGKMPDGYVDEAARRLAAASGQRLMQVAKKHEADPDARARALYIAGNAFRMAHADVEASTAYETCSTLSAAKDTGYPAKCSLGLGTIRARNGDVQEALRLYRECSLQRDDARTSERCGKSVARTQLVGVPAPELEVETWLNSTPHPLASLRGKVVMLFFFATWCPHCKETLPTLPRYLEKFGGKDFELMAITNNVRGQTTEIAKLFVQDPQWKISYPVAVDANGSTTMAMEASGIPQVILIDKRGIVRWSDHPAYLKDEMIEKLVAEPGGA